MIKLNLKRLKELDAMIQVAEIDCGDSSCAFKDNRSKGGQHTNGGCRCLRDVRPFAARRAFEMSLKTSRTELPKLVAWIERAIPFLQADCCNGYDNGREKLLAEIE